MGSLSDQKKEVRDSWEKAADGEQIQHLIHAPDDYIPDVERKLHMAYLDLRCPCSREFRWYVFWALMAGAALALVLLGGKLYALFPALDAWVTQSTRNFYIHFGCMILFLQIIGWYVPARRLELSFENNTPVYLFMLGGIFAWTMLYFSATAGPGPDSKVQTVLYHIIKWPFLIYFAGIFVFHLGYLREEFPDLVRYYRNLPRRRKDYMRTYEGEMDRLRQELHLWQLRMGQEKVPTPMWLIRFGNRLREYDEAYKKLTK